MQRHRKIGNFIEFSGQLGYCELEGKTACIIIVVVATFVSNRLASWLKNKCPVCLLVIQFWRNLSSCFSLLSLKYLIHFCLLQERIGTTNFWCLRFWHSMVLRSILFLMCCKFSKGWNSFSYFLSVKSIYDAKVSSQHCLHFFGISQALFLFSHAKMLK